MAAYTTPISEKIPRMNVMLSITTTLSKHRLHDQPKHNEPEFNTGIDIPNQTATDLKISWHYTCGDAVRGSQQKQCNRGWHWPDDAQREPTASPTGADGELCGLRITR
jgi:hypothetical protein